MWASTEGKAGPCPSLSRAAPEAGEVLSENRLRGSADLSPQLSPAHAGRGDGNVWHSLQEGVSFLLGPAVP